MRKVGLSLLGGVAALALAASPLGGADASAIGDSNMIEIDHIDLTNSQDYVVQDEQLAEMFDKMIASTGSNEICFTINNGKFTQLTSDDDLPLLCVLKEDDKIIMYDDLLQDNVVSYDDIVGLVTCVTDNNETGCLWGNYILVGDLTDIGNFGGNISDDAVLNQYIYNIGKIYTGKGYAIIDGEDQTIDDDEDLVIHTTGNLEYLESVEIDGNALEEADYDAEDGGSVFVTIHADAIKALSKGKHTVKINFSEIVLNEQYSIPAGSVSTEFTYGENPDTADLDKSVFVLFAISMMPFVYWAGSKMVCKIRR